MSTETTISSPPPVLDEQYQSDIAWRMEGVETPEQSRNTPFESPRSEAFWSCEMLVSATVGGLGASDWDSTFDDLSNERIAFGEVAPLGSFRSMVTNSLNRPIRCQLAFQNDLDDYTAKAYLAGDSFGRVQIKVNGDLANFTGSGDVDLNFSRGYNLIQISVSEAMDKVELYTAFLDGNHAKFIDPRVQTASVRAAPSLAGA